MKKLRMGITTGLCAAAAAKAATLVLLCSTNLVYQVEITATSGETFCLEVTDTVFESGTVKCAVIKDAGDDPDITNGLKVFASVSKTTASGIEIDGGEGIGRVTKPGLKVPVGKAAINPVPMEMIKNAIECACVKYSYAGGIRAVISIPGGAEIAKRTMNGRLGIVGGLSVLGTTGIVEPMSDRAVVETTKAEIDVKVASGIKNLLITPGNYGRDFAGNEIRLNTLDAIKCSNFIGETLDYVCMKGIDKITLIGHAGKLVKLAGGVMNTHSTVADCRMEIIAAHSALMGANAAAIQRIMECVTTEAAINVLIQTGTDGCIFNKTVWESIGHRIGFHLRERTKGRVIVEYIVFTQEHGILCQGSSAQKNVI